LASSAILTFRNSLRTPPFLTPLLKSDLIDSPRGEPEEKGRKSRNHTRMSEPDAPRRGGIGPENLESAAAVSRTAIGRSRQMAILERGSFESRTAGSHCIGDVRQRRISTARVGTVSHGRHLVHPIVGI
jgi:hypothetical protein